MGLPRPMGPSTFVLTGLLSVVLAVTHGSCAPLVLFGLALLAADAWALAGRPCSASVLAGFLRPWLAARPAAAAAARGGSSPGPKAPSSGPTASSVPSPAASADLPGSPVQAPGPKPGRAAADDVAGDRGGGPRGVVGAAGAAGAAAFKVCFPTVRDAPALQELYERDYVTCHRHLHAGAAAGARQEDWRAALGFIDFESVVRDNTAAKGKGSVRLLKCVKLDPSTPGAQGTLVGYVLYELREKGSPRRRQRFCELVNIVVQEDLRSCGAGRRLFDALCADLTEDPATVARAGDLRLYVAEKNAGPLSWYRRLGFTDAGWQTEHLGSSEVRFLRMARRGPPQEHK